MYTGESCKATTRCPFPTFPFSHFRGNWPYITQDIPKRCIDFNKYNMNSNHWNSFTFHLSSLFSLAKSLHKEISATYRLVSNLLADRCLICRLHIQFIISKRQCVCCHFLQKQYIPSKTILKLITCTFWDTWHHHKTPENLSNNL